MIALVFLFIAGSLVTNCMFAGNIRRNAEGLANEWIAELYPEVQATDIHVSCQAADSDHNGYVTCSVRIAEERLNLECVAYTLVNPGNSTCREVVPMRSMGSRR